MAAFYRENDSGMTCDFMASWIQSFLNSARLPQHDVRTRRESFGLPLLFISFRHVQVISRSFPGDFAISSWFPGHFPSISSPFSKVRSDFLQFQRESGTLQGWLRAKAQLAVDPVASAEAASATASASMAEAPAEAGKTKAE